MAAALLVTLALGGCCDQRYDPATGTYFRDGDCGGVVFVGRLIEAMVVQ